MSSSDELSDFTELKNMQWPNSASYYDGSNSAIEEGVMASPSLPNSAANDGSSPEDDCAQEDVTSDGSSLDSSCAQGEVTASSPLSLTPPTPAVPFPCLVCGKPFVRLYDGLRRHMREVHPEVKDLECKECGEKFAMLSELKKHEHSHKKKQERPRKTFPCTMCEKVYKDRKALKYHMAKHSGEVPEKRTACEVCGKTFTSSTELRYHMRTHTGEKPYTCKDCGKSFTMNSYLLKHTHHA
jgi:uncharacterized Zn-finger protein